MALTQLGARKIAAGRVGLTLEEYDQRVASGLKWCSRGRHWAIRGSFCSDSCRADGLAASCNECRRAEYKKTYAPKQRVSKRGSRYAKVRSGDKLQARARINHLIAIGLLSNPNSVPCAECGHIGPDRRHLYDHHRGYDAEHQETAEAVCYQCDGVRRKRRGENAQRLIVFGGRTQSLSQWAREIGIDTSTLRERLQKWSIERALTTPKMR